MGKSITYHLALIVLKLKGIKRTFKKDPLDYLALRKEDVKQPSKRMFAFCERTTLDIANSTITQIIPNDPKNYLIIYIHGGAFVSGPAKHHWDTIKTIAKQTNYKVWMVDYPKAPENKIDTISENIDAVYARAIEDYSEDKIMLVGDSAGGALALSLTQRLIKNGIRKPEKLIAITPVVDASLSNFQIDKVDKIDPMLSKKGVLSAKKMCAVKNNLKDPRISPIFGDFDNFPETILFSAEHDILYPDQLLLVKVLEEKKIDFKVITGKEMPHIWPILPVMKESKTALQTLIDTLKQ